MENICVENLWNFSEEIWGWITRNALYILIGVVKLPRDFLSPCDQSRIIVAGMNVVKVLLCFLGVWEERACYLILL